MVVFYGELSVLTLSNGSSSLLSCPGGGKTTLTFWHQTPALAFLFIFVLPQKVVIVWIGLLLKNLGVNETVKTVKSSEAGDHLWFYIETPGDFADLGLSFLFYQRVGWIAGSQILPGPGMEFLVCKETRLDNPHALAVVVG